jgi:hypothetical protein
LNEKQKAVFNCVILYFLLAVALCGAGFGLFYKLKYDKLSADHAQLQSSVDAANSGELQRKYDAAIDKLRDAQSSLDELRQSVDRLEEVDRRRAEGFGRVRDILDDTAKSTSGITSGEQRARIAFEAIARITDELEAEFESSAE